MLNTPHHIVEEVVEVLDDLGALSANHSFDPARVISFARPHA